MARRNPILEAEPTIAGPVASILGVLPSFAAMLMAGPLAKEPRTARRPSPFVLRHPCRSRPSVIGVVTRLTTELAALTRKGHRRWSATAAILARDKTPRLAINQEGVIRIPAQRPPARNGESTCFSPSETGPSRLPRNQPSLGPTAIPRRGGP